MCSALFTPQTVGCWPSKIAVLPLAGRSSSTTARPAPLRVKDLYVRYAAERGLRLISYDRPGFGESSPQPGRIAADTAADVSAICTDEAAARRKLDKDREKLLAGPTTPRGTKDGLAPGNQGWWDDNSMQLRPWGFNLADVAVPVLLCCACMSFLAVTTDRKIIRRKWARGTRPGPEVVIGPIQGRYGLEVR